MKKIETKFLKEEEALSWAAKKGYTVICINRVDGGYISLTVL